MYKVLVVDDQKIIREGLIKILNRNTCGIEEIFEADCGQAAEDIALALKPHIIVTDIKMPDFSGLELIKKLKPRLKGTKFVVLSGYDDFQFAREAIRLEVVDYLLKPVNRSDVEELIGKIIGSLRRETGFTGCEDVPAAIELKNENADGHRGKIIEYALDYIHKNYYRDITLAFVANLVSRNYSYFSNIFRSETGYAFSDYLRIIRMEKAKVLLKDMRYKINDIAKMVGYPDPIQFSKTFSRAFGMTPGQFRSGTK